MESNWPIVQLKDYCIKIGSGATPRGGSSVYKEKGEICLIRSQNIYNDGFKSNGLVFIDEAAADKLKNVIVEPNDILLNITGDSVARVCNADPKYIPARVNQHVAIIRPKPEEFDTKYLRYFLSSPLQQSLLLTLASAGATRNALTKSMIESLEVPKPSIPEQKSIAHILGSLDDKIELNHQMNQTLEQMAQTLFKSWFVDFDPVIDNALSTGNPIPEELQAKAEKRKALGKERKALPEDIQKLFPDEFEYSEELEKWVPRGWTYSKLSDVTKKITDGTHSTVKDDVNGKFYLLSCKNIKNGQIVFNNKDRKINEKTLNQLRKRTQLTKGDVLITTVGTIGEVAMIRQDKIQWELQRSVAIIRPNNKDIFSEFLYQLSKTNDFQHQAISKSKGSVQTCLFIGAIKEIDFILPDKRIIEVFEKYASSYYQKVTKNFNTNKQLTKLRNTLLPKLISGEVRVQE